MVLELLEVVLELLEVVLELLELVLGLLELVLELLELVLSLSLSYLNVFLVSAVGVAIGSLHCPKRDRQGLLPEGAPLKGAPEALEHDLITPF